jgi:hypothetical protein
MVSTVSGFSGSCPGLALGVALCVAHVFGPVCNPNIGYTIEIINEQ